MSDLIRRQDAIEVLATMQGLCTSKTALIQNSKIWQQIKDLPSAQQWIPCSERPPEVGDEVLIYSPKTDCIFRNSIKRWDYSHGGCEHTEISGFACTAMEHEGVVINMVGLDKGCFCEMYESREDYARRKEYDRNDRSSHNG